MAIDSPPTDVSQLVARVTASAANIAKHRAAMAEVAAQAKLTVPAQPKEGVKPQ